MKTCLPTVVELVIVIAVIAILASVLMPTFSSVVEKANQASALQEANFLLKQDVLDYIDINGGTVPNGTVYEVNGYYFKVSDNALVSITEEEYNSLNQTIKNIIFLIPDGASFGTYDIANAYKQKYSATAVNGIVDGIKDTATASQGTTITTNAIAGKTVTGLYLDNYLIASSNTYMYHKYGHDSSGATDSAQPCGKYS